MVRATANAIWSSGWTGRPPTVAAGDTTARQALERWSLIDGHRSTSVNDDMSTDPEQVRVELAALLADLPEPDAPEADIEAIAARLEEAHDLLVQALQAVERNPVGGNAAGRGDREVVHVTRRARVDAELVRRGLARSRQQAAELIGAGRVSIDGLPAAKPATAITLDARLIVADADERNWVSRGAHKLNGALDAFAVTVDGRRCLDAGASTGGFTEVLLDRGAREVVAADVGYGQLAWSLRSDPRVTVMERTNVRDLTADAIGGPVDLVVADLSFISLSTVLPALTACASAGADIVPMVKPQFEVGKDRVGAGGVVSDPALRAESVLTVARRAAELDWFTVDVTASPLPGPSGNVEYFLRLRATHRPPARRRRAGGRSRTRRRRGPAMTCERTVLLVVHTGRDEATETARRVEKVLGDNGIATAGTRGRSRRPRPRST